MGGSSGTNQQQPSTPQQIDYEKLMAESSKYGAQSYRDQLAAQIAAYPKLEGLQLGTIRKIAGNLNNDYTKEAKGVIDQTYKSGASALIDTGNRISAQGDQASVLSKLAGDRATSELALGTSLNPEEERAASQQATSAYSMRGLGTGNSAAAADLLNRYSYGQQRYQQRLSNAGAAQGMMGNTANLYGQAGGAYQNAANLGFAGANALVNLDPYQRALGQGIQLGSGIQGQSGQMIGGAFQNAQQLAGDVASYNTNMASGMYNNYNNNQTSLATSRNAANGQMQGAAMGASAVIGAAAAACWVARAVFGTATDRWKEFRRAMLRSASDRFIRTYCKYGPWIAAGIEGNQWAKRPGRLILGSLQSAWS